MDYLLRVILVLIVSIYKGFGLRISEGSVENLLKQSAKCLQPIYDQIANRILCSKVMGGDETGMSLHGQKERYQMAKEKYELNLIDFFEFATYQNQLRNAELDWNFNQEIVQLYK